LTRRFLFFTNALKSTLSSTWTRLTIHWGTNKSLVTIVTDVIYVITVVVVDSIIVIAAVALVAERLNKRYS
jgi:hypothetical protein